MLYAVLLLIPELNAPSDWSLPLARLPVEAGPLSRLSLAEAVTS